MGWRRGVTVFLILKYISSVVDISHAFTLPEEVSNNIDTIANDDDNNVPISNYQDVKLEELGRLLENILIQPWPKGTSPLLYIENYHPLETVQDGISVDDRVNEDFNNVPYKRSRYYRKYPWKRQNSRYEADNKYLCQPTKEDVFRLLVALHQARQGFREHNVNFCNRRRPAKAVFTNIRFLG